MRKYFLYFAIVGMCYCATTSPPKNQPTPTSTLNKPITGPANVPQNSTSSAKAAPPGQLTNRLSSTSSVSGQSTKKSASPSSVSLLQSRLGSANSESLQSRLGSSSNVKLEITNRLGYVYKNITSAANRIITTRFGGQCQCVSYHLCDKKDVYLTDPNDDLSTVSCDNQYQTCCKMSEEPLTSAPDHPEYALSSTVSNPNSGCVCVSADRCNDQSDIAAIINPKIPCPTGEICCSSVSTEPSVNVPISSTDSNPSATSATDLPIEYTCVPSYAWCSNLSLTDNFGLNVIMEKVSPCTSTEYYCPTIDVIVQTPDNGNGVNNGGSDNNGGGNNTGGGNNNGIGANNGGGDNSGGGNNNGIGANNGGSDNNGGGDNNGNGTNNAGGDNNGGGNNNGSPVDQNPEDYVRCGYRRLSNDIGQKITATEDPTTTTSFGEFPWMALIVRHLGDRDSVVCGASIVTPSVVLTAAHCVKTLNKDSIFVRGGEYDTFVDSESEPRPHQDRNISEIIIHPGYRPGILFNDFAFLVLKTEFEFTANVAPICLPLLGSTFAADDIYDANQCIATGWGKNAYNATAQYQNTLRKVDLRLIAHNDCEQRLRTSKLGANFKLDSSFVCAVGDNGKDTCQGDGGGPLFCALKDTPNRYIQVGIISWGIGCGNEFPGVYASFYSVGEWLSTEFNTYNNFMTYTRIRL